MNGTQVIVPSDQATQWGVNHGFGWLYFLEQQGSILWGVCLTVVIVLFLAGILVSMARQNNNF